MTEQAVGAGVDILAVMGGDGMMHLGRQRWSPAAAGGVAGPPSG